MKIIFYLPVNTGKPKFVAFFVFVCMAASFIAQISSFRLLAPVAKQWIAEDIPSYWSQSAHLWGWYCERLQSQQLAQLLLRFLSRKGSNPTCLSSHWRDFFLPGQTCHRFASWRRLQRSWSSLEDVADLWNPRLLLQLHSSLRRYQNLSNFWSSSQGWWTDQALFHWMRILRQLVVWEHNE